MRGFGRALSFEGADGATADAVSAQLQAVAHATSVGGVEPASDRWAQLHGQQHIPDGLFRLRVGSKHIEDLGPTSTEP